MSSRRAVTCCVEEQMQAELGLKHNSFLPRSEQESGLAWTRLRRSTAYQGTGHFQAVLLSTGFCSEGRMWPKGQQGQPRGKGENVLWEGNGRKSVCLCWVGRAEGAEICEISAERKQKTRQNPQNLWV